MLFEHGLAGFPGAQVREPRSSLCAERGEGARPSFREHGRESGRFPGLRDGVPAWAGQGKLPGLRDGVPAWPGRWHPPARVPACARTPRGLQRSALLPCRRVRTDDVTQEDFYSINMGVY